MGATAGLNGKTNGSDLLDTDAHGVGRVTLPWVPPEVTAVCDNTSVGVIITDDQGRLLMLQRVKPPAGIAPVAGHIDGHGSPEAAAYAEVAEEVGLTVTSLTLLVPRYGRGNVCRRQHGPEGPGHWWTIFRASVTGDITPGVEEVRNVRWYTPEEVQRLAYRTAAYACGDITPAAFEADPGLEPVWVHFLAGHFDLSSAYMAKIDRLACRSPYPQPDTEGH